MTTETTGTVRIEADGSGTVHMDRVYPTGIDDLWDAVTTPERLARWLVVQLDGVPAVGKTVRAAFTSSWDGSVRIDECDRPAHLRVTMLDDQDTTVTEAWLTAVDADHTRLVLEERGFRADEVADHGAGWQVHVEDLATVLDGGEPEPWEPRWRALRPGYLAAVPGGTSTAV
ncbi:SRPBCC domain-containing protein [Curtobacterium sp. ISL-83]|uniref:SRPBCC domain-containing protein n=1 Tax=Curtobacterium sp. ISL-83 TaxID=2819145 RepID=UPI001BEBF157|nr:SRPBCC domain-containing protein [Curtobacterium sp. ISL-83]MBT2501863.1 SRPBCC domain-containing protein [Curtobacterium sp. ISL-83]